MNRDLADKITRPAAKRRNHIIYNTRRVNRHLGPTCQRADTLLYAGTLIIPDRLSDALYYYYTRSIGVRSDHSTAMCTTWTVLPQYQVDRARTRTTTRSCRDPEMAVSNFCCFCGRRRRRRCCCCCCVGKVAVSN